MAKYPVTGGRQILKTTKLYPDGKTQVPKEVIKHLKLEKGSQIVWILDENRIVVESPRI